MTDQPMPPKKNPGMNRLIPRRDRAQEDGLREGRTSAFEEIPRRMMSPTAPRTRPKRLQAKSGVFQVHRWAMKPTVR